MKNLLETTTDHKIIRKWAQKFGAIPYLINNGSQQALAIGFPEKEKDTVLISWDEWFAHFEEQQLILEYSSKKSETEKVPYHRLIRREGTVDRHLQAPGEANRDKHINFLEQEEKINNW